MQSAGVNYFRNILPWSYGLATDELPFGAFQLAEAFVSPPTNDILCKYFYADFALAFLNRPIRVQQVTNTEAVVCTA